jgi:hypothetical protein
MISEPRWNSEIGNRLAKQMLPQPDFEPQEHVLADSLQERHRRGRALFPWLFEQEPDFLVTIKFNEQLSNGQLRQRLRHFDAMLDRHFLGEHWAKFSSAERAFFIAFLERDANGLHVHMLMRLPRKVSLVPAWKLVPLSKAFTELGRRKGVCPYGDILFLGIGDYRSGHNACDQARAISYVLKDFSSGWNSEFFLAAEFHPILPASAATQSAA